MSKREVAELAGMVLLCVVWCVLALAVLAIPVAAVVYFVQMSAPITVKVVFIGLTAFACLLIGAMVSEL